MNRVLTIILTMALLSASVVVRAQDSIQMDLRQCLQYALQSNTQIGKAHLDYEGGEAKTKEVKARALPQVNLSANLTDNLLLPVIVIPGEFFGGDPGSFRKLQSGLQYNTNATVEASQKLWDQSVLTGIRAAKASENYYQQNITSTEEEVIRQTASLFYQAASVQAQKEILESTLAEAKESLKITTDRYQNGIARKLDVDRLRVNVTNLETQLLSVKDSYLNILNQLKLLLGMDIDTPVKLYEPLLSDSSTYQYDPSIIENGWSWENKVEYKQLSTQLELYDLEKKSFSAGYFPVLSAFARYSYQGQSNEFDLFKDNSSAVWFDVASVGLNLSIPIFDGFQKSAQIQQSKIRRMKTERDMSFVKQQSNMLYRNALNTFETNYKNYLAQKDNVVLAQEVYNVTEQNYNEGVSPLTDLLAAETSRIQAENQLIDALLKVKQAEVDLLKSKGEIKNLLN